MTQTTVACSRRQDMHRRSATLAIAVVLAFATVAAAQTPAPSLASSLTIGQRVRVHSNAEPRFIIGGVSAVDDEFLTVVPDGSSPVKIAAGEIASVEVSRGRKRNWLKGFVVGLAIGAGLGFAFDVDPANCGPDTVYYCSRSQALVAGTVVFGTIGSGVGALITSERWRPIDPVGSRAKSSTSPTRLTRDDSDVALRRDGRP
jgi:hypothetical protein